MNIDWGKAPEGATHYLPDSREDYECWVKPGYSMRIGKQTKWYVDTSIDRDIQTGKALPRPLSVEQREKIRQKVIAEIVTDGNCYPEQAALLYDAGYRKFEIVEEDV